MAPAEVKKDKPPRWPNRNNMGKIPLVVMSDWYLNTGWVYHGHMFRWMTKRLKILKFKSLMGQSSAWHDKEAAQLERAVAKFYGSPISKLFYLNRKSNKSLGIACYLKGNKMEMLIGSRGSTFAAPSLRNSVVDLRTRLENSNILDKNTISGLFWLNNTVTLPSPSVAGSFICGSPISGPLHWRTFDGTPLKKALKENL